MTFDMADIRPSVLSWLIVTLMAITGISLMKYLMVRWPIPGFADLVAAV